MGRASGRAVTIGLVATKPYGPSTAASALWACVGTGESYLANAYLSVAKSDVYRAVPNGGRAPLSNQHAGQRFACNCHDSGGTSRQLWGHTVAGRGVGCCMCRSQLQISESVQLACFRNLR